MPDRPRVHFPLISDVEHMARMRRLIKEARKLLERPVPDTFLGRETALPEIDPDDIPTAPRQSVKGPRPQRR